MKQIQVLLALLAASLASAEPQTAAIYIQAIQGGIGNSDPAAKTAAAPMPLAEITYDLAKDYDNNNDDGDGDDSSSSRDSSEGDGNGRRAEVTAFEPPELPESTRLVRIGVYDAAAGGWLSSTSVASVESFGKGYSPHFVLSLDASAAAGAGHNRQQHNYVGASCRGVRVDAGATRDFGPQAVVVLGGRGRQPALNRPVVLSAEGKQVPPAEEKTMLQKYWWVIGIVLFLLVSGGGDGK